MKDKLTQTWNRNKKKYLKTTSPNFSRKLFCSFDDKNVVLKEFRECMLQDDDGRCKDVNRNLQLYWRDLHALSGCVFPDERVALQNSFQEAVLESLHLIHPGSWGIIFLS